MRHSRRDPRRPPPCFPPPTRLRESEPTAMQVSVSPGVGYHDDSDTDSTPMLHAREMFWYANREWLREQGYVLRARLQEEWSPTYGWQGAASDSEDAYIWPQDNIMDATRAVDGAFVLMKRIARARDAQELEIATWLAEHDRAHYCVPILRVLAREREPDWVILVMPLLREYDSPRLQTVGEAVEFFRQMFLGIGFLHENNIVHGDCSSKNILMDGGPLYAAPWHPIRQDFRRDWTGKASHSTRTRHPVRYHWIDFSSSRRLLSDEGDTSGDRAAAKFKADVYRLGKSIEEDFLVGTEYKRPKRGLDFMRPLVAAMTHPDPARRPTMDECMRHLEELVRGLGSCRLRSRLAERGDLPLVHAVPHWVRHVLFVLKRLPPIPVPS
ncbi:unnamed protein product [Mycena citricolor]|uniref:Protein kinase domain-containing protein n=1 Tax=Mycena citricolor TaxID=2018698 RepID=A0AAD2GXL9_9AGAR|nr:unnamed protein product [Mycena citricolor]